MRFRGQRRPRFDASIKPELNRSRDPLTEAGKPIPLPCADEGAGIVKRMPGPRHVDPPTASGTCVYRQRIDPPAAVSESDVSCRMKAADTGQNATAGVARGTDGAIH